MKHSEITVGMRVLYDGNTCIVRSYNWREERGWELVQPDGNGMGTLRYAAAEDLERSCIREITRFPGAYEPALSDSQALELAKSTEELHKWMDAHGVSGIGIWVGPGVLTATRHMLTYADFSDLQDSVHAIHAFLASGVSIRADESLKRLAFKSTVKAMRACIDSISSCFEET